ncbi:packaged DNA stabilization gp4 family protein, partial [Thiocapsa sp. N5-Cardenillas]|uniref:packaged DNA stabilization gp4 family protein n=1 Tax=Thiocapsa sp. N5-Cardenillas TaxID=3137397 RepID=UPI0035B0EA50
MSYSKRQFVEGAFEEIGLASYVYDLQPQDYQTGLRRLDAMMAEWNARGLRLGYPLPSAPQDSDIDAATDIPDAANEAVVLNLAIRLASGYGKTVAPATAALAKRALDTVTAWTAGRP